MENKIYASEERFFDVNDSKTIQNAVDYAEKNGIETVVIPKLNSRTSENIWKIDEVILLPSAITVILEDAHLKLEVGVRSNVFRNRNAWTEFGKTMEGEQYGIRIIGEGNAVIDGGFPNGLCEQFHRSRPDLYPHMCVNLLVFLHNVRDFEVSGIRFVESRWWATCFMFCRNGRIADLDFRMYGNIENQDGVDLRIGCENIIVENITGITGDDTVAMTAYPHWEGFEKELWVEGKSFDIHDIIVRNITSSTHGCGIVRLLNCDGAKEYNITIENITDTGKSSCGSGVIVGVGSDSFAPVRSHTFDEFYNITIRNVKSSGQVGLEMCEPCRDMVIENITTFGENIIGLFFAKNFVGENISVKNFVLSSDNSVDSFITARCENRNALDGVKIENVRIEKANAVFRGIKADVKDMNVSCETKDGEFSEEFPELPLIYGKYHRYFHDELIKNRPENSRWANEQYDI